MNLHHDFSAGHRVMMHIRVEIRETTGWEISHLAFVKAISHPDFKSPTDNSDVFPLGMPMRRDAISVRHLQTYGVISAAGAWIALKYRELCPCGDKCRCRTVWNRIGSECVF